MMDPVSAPPPDSTPSPPPHSSGALARSQRWLQGLEKHPHYGWGLLGLWTVLVAGLAFFSFLGSIGLVDETEPLFAEASRQMGLRGDWVTPYFNEYTRFDKPPLIYWLMAFAYNLFGVNAWTVRLPSALSATLLLGGVGYTLARFGQPRRGPSAGRWLAAFLGVACTGLNLEMLIWGRVGTSDMLLASCFGMALLTFFGAYATPVRERAWHWTQEFTAWGQRDRLYGLSVGWVALAILAKGPVGLVLPAAIALGFLVYVSHSWRDFWGRVAEMRPVRGMFGLTAIALPWYILVIQANGEEYIHTFFGYHNVQRFTTTVNNHPGPWFFYVLIVLIGFAPWSFYTPAALHAVQVWRRKAWRSRPREEQLPLFALTWFLGVFIFFTIAATKLPSYILPAFPALGMLVALLFSELMLAPSPAGDSSVVDLALHKPGLHKPRLHKPALNKSAGFNIGMLVFLAIAFFSGYWWLQVIDDPAMPEFPQALQRSGLLAWGGTLCLIGAIAAFVLHRRQQNRWQWSASLVGFASFIGLWLFPTGALLYRYRQYPLYAIAQTIVAQRQPNEEVLMVGFEKPTLVFYTERPVLFFRRARTALRHLQSHSLTQPTPDSVLLVTHPHSLPDLGLGDTHRDRYEILHRDGNYILIRLPKPQLRQWLWQLPPLDN